MDCTSERFDNKRRAMEGFMQLQYNLLSIDYKTKAYNPDIAQVSYMLSAAASDVSSGI